MAARIVGMRPCGLAFRRRRLRNRGGPSSGETNSAHRTGRRYDRDSLIPPWQRRLSGLRVGGSSGGIRNCSSGARHHPRQASQRGGLFRYWGWWLGQVPRGPAAKRSLWRRRNSWMRRRRGRRINFADRYLRWNADWAEGRSAQPLPRPIPMHPAGAPDDVLDDVVAKLLNKSAFLEPRRTVFVGHGGGAQMLTRYAVVMRS